MWENLAIIPNRLAAIDCLKVHIRKFLFFWNSLINAACDEGPDLFAHLLKVFSVMLLITTLPFSLFFAVKVVQEYERAVIFRLGRLVAGGARGPGVFFVVPCVDR